MLASVVALSLTATFAPVQDSIPAARLLDQATEALGLAHLEGVSGVSWTELGIQRWTGQGVDGLDSDRVRHLTRHVSASREAGRLRRTFRQTTSTGEVEWCEETRIDGGRLATIDCVTGVTTTRDLGGGSGPPLDVVRIAMVGLPHPSVLAMAGSAGVRGLYARGTGEGTVWELEVVGRGGSRERWRFDAGTGLPLEVRRPDRDEFGASTMATDRWSDWRRVDGVAFPHTIERERSNRAPGELTVLDSPRLSALGPLPDVSPADPTPDPSIPRAVALGTDSWVLQDVVPTYNALLKRDGRRAVLVDAPGGERGASALDSLLASVGVERLTAVVLTHDHPDHVSALTRLEVPVDRVLAPPRAAARLSDLLGREVEPAGGDVVLATGLRFELLAAGPHVDELLIAVLPETLFVADLVATTPSGVLRPLGAEARPLLDHLADAERTPETVWPSHGRGLPSSSLSLGRR